MTVTAHFIEHAFLILLALFALIECALAILQTRSAENARTVVPRGFEGHLTRASMVKAADYTSETAQSELVLAFVGAIFALLMTQGRGLSILIVLCEHVAHGVTAQWLLLAVLTFLMCAIEFPFAWWAQFRVEERYGYMRLSQKAWLLRTMKETLVGWFVMLPVWAVLLMLFEHSGNIWWVILWGAWTLWLVWRFKVSQSHGLFWHRRVKPWTDKAFEARVKAYLEKNGVVFDGMVVTTRPASWHQASVVLSGLGRKRRVVVFAHAANVLTEDELMALIAHETAQVRHHHALIRILFFSALGAVVAGVAAWGAQHPVFFEGFGLASFTIFVRPGTQAGYVLAVGLVTFPVIVYLMRPVTHLLSRWMQFDADAVAVRDVGAEPLVSALVRLNKDRSQTLNPSLLYEFFHHRRPHIGARVAHAYRLADKEAA